MHKAGKFLKILFMCHSRPERSFYFKGEQFPIWVLGIIYGILSEVPQGYITISILLPLIADGVIQSLGIKESNNIRRIITGILFGMGTIFIFIYFHRTMVKVAIIFLKKYIFIQ